MNCPAQRPDAARRQVASRPGWALMEMCVAISLTGVLLTMLVTLLASLIQYQHSAHDRSLARAEVDRLTDALRQDLHTASEVTQPDGGTLLLEVADGPPVRYVLDGDRCRRSRSAADDRRAEFERFAIGPATAWQIGASAEQAADLGSAVTTITIEREPAEEQSRPLPPIRVVAARQSQ